MTEKGVKRVVRSPWDLKGYVDHETDFPGPTVDSSAAESAQERVAKFLRGGSTSGASGVYDVEADGDPATALENMDVTRTAGFDLADGSRLARAGQEALARLRTENVSKPKAEKPKAVEADPEPKAPVSEPPPLEAE